MRVRGAVAGMALVLGGFLAFAACFAALLLGFGLLSVFGGYVFIGALAFLLGRTFFGRSKQISSKRLTAADIDRRILAEMRVRFPGDFEGLGDFYRLKRDFDICSNLREKQRRLMPNADVEVARLRLSIDSEDFDYKRWLESIRERLLDPPEYEKVMEIEREILFISCSYSSEVWDSFERLKTELDMSKLKSQNS